MGRLTSTCLIAIACGAPLGIPSIASAQQAEDATRTAARALGTAGVEALQTGDVGVATDKLEKAYIILKVPSLGLWSARALVKRGLLVEAAQRYQEVSELPLGSGDTSVQQQAQADAKAELEALRPRVPTLRIRVVDADLQSVSVFIDGKQIEASLIDSPQPINPGTHQVGLMRGAEHTVTSVSVAEGGRQSIELRLGPQAPAAKDASSNQGPEPATAAGASDHAVSTKPEDFPGKRSASSTLPTLGWIAVGVGGAGIVLGGVTGVIAMSKKSNLDSDPRCHNESCPPSSQAKVDSLMTMRSVSTAGFIAGGVLAGTGAIILLTSRSPNKSETQAWVMPNGIVLRRTF
ncbi:MAG TPA: hypothetical protein VGI10_03500 [Polyangiaceae bacterium]|jgi:hypothetical protein